MKGDPLNTLKIFKKSLTVPKNIKRGGLLVSSGCVRVSPFSRRILVENEPRLLQWVVFLDA